MDQLKLKHAKKAKADEGDQLVQPGRGRGRGRGRGCVVKDKSAGSEKGKPRKTKDSKKENKQSAMDGGQFFMGTPLMSGLLGMQHALGPKTMSTGKGLRLRHGTK